MMMRPSGNDNEDSGSEPSLSALLDDTLADGDGETLVTEVVPQPPRQRTTAVASTVNEAAQEDDNAIFADLVHVGTIDTSSVSSQHVVLPSQSTDTAGTTASNNAGPDDIGGVRNNDAKKSKECASKEVMSTTDIISSPKPMLERSVSPSLLETKLVDLMNDHVRGNNDALSTKSSSKGATIVSMPQSRNIGNLHVCTARKKAPPVPRYAEPTATSTAASLSPSNDHSQASLAQLTSEYWKHLRDDDSASAPSPLTSSKSTSRWTTQSRSSSHKFHGISHSRSVEDAHDDRSHGYLRPTKSSNRRRESFTLAESGEAFSHQLRSGHDTSKPRSSAHNSRGLTVPQAPNFNSTLRQKAAVKSTAEREEEMLKQKTRPFKAKASPHFDACPSNASTTRSSSMSSPRNAAASSTKPWKPTQPRPFSFVTDQRAAAGTHHHRDHEMAMSSSRDNGDDDEIIKPFKARPYKAPPPNEMLQEQLAKEQRRKQALKSKQDDELRKQSSFKARPLPKSIYGDNTTKGNGRTATSK